MTKYPHIAPIYHFNGLFLFLRIVIVKFFKALFKADNCGWATITTLLFEVTLADGIWTVNLLLLLFIFDDCALLLMLLSPFDNTLEILEEIPPFVFRNNTGKAKWVLEKQKDKFIFLSYFVKMTSNQII